MTTNISYELLLRLSWSVCLGICLWVWWSLGQRVSLSVSRCNVGLEIPTVYIYAHYVNPLFFCAVLRLPLSYCHWAFATELLPLSLQTKLTETQSEHFGICGICGICRPKNGAQESGLLGVSSGAGDNIETTDNNKQNQAIEQHWMTDCCSQLVSNTCRWSTQLRPQTSHTMPVSG